MKLARKRNHRHADRREGNKPLLILCVDLKESLKVFLELVKIEQGHKTEDQYTKIN